ncbi:hypothetical protein NE237_008030 [Protea cynaroides]|uniref:Uncharacterized protein n=1 Tax=Protea cynaroides TaxID=273540 RepID=A0A9Q0KRC2_9MAGN|nr:hypothetical protein NE237_008030 [Protea cynaroides]
MDFGFIEKQNLQVCPIASFLKKVQFIKTFLVQAAYAKKRSLLINIDHCNQFRRSSTSGDSRFSKFSAISISVTCFYPDFQVLSGMDTQKGQSQPQQPSSDTTPASTSCRKKKSDDASFLEDLRDHMDEFILASMDEHQACFKKTMQKMFGMSKIVAEKSSEPKEVESIMPLQTTVAD